MFPGSEVLSGSVQDVSHQELLRLSQYLRSKTLSPRIIAILATARSDRYCETPALKNMGPKLLSP
jgi:hypothetical protein